MDTKIVQIQTFLWNEFWYTGIQSPHLCKWPWTLNWSKWILLVDIPTQILLTIMGYINYSSRCKLDVYIISHTKFIPFTEFVRRWKSKVWAKSDCECLILISVYSNSNLQSLVRTPTLDCWYIGIHTEEKPSKSLLFPYQNT